jgi:hypothetical protein
MFSIKVKLIYVSCVPELVFHYCLTFRFLIICNSHLTTSLLIFPNSAIILWTYILSSAIWRQLSCKKNFISNFSFVLHFWFSFSNGKLDMHLFIYIKNLFLSKNKRLSSLHIIFHSESSEQLIIRNWVFQIHGKQSVGEIPLLCRNSWFPFSIRIVL